MSRNWKTLTKNNVIKAAGILPMIAVGNVMISASAEAAILNAGFENGFNNWTTVGNVSIDNGAIGITPPFGSSQALLTTGTGAAPAGTIPTLETALGLAPGELDANPLFQAFEGSAVVQEITVAAGETISFNYNFLTNDSNATSPLPLPRDYAFVVLDGTVISLADTSSSSLAASSTAFAQENGYQTYTSDPLAAGTYTLGIGVVDIQDNAVDSALLVDAPQDDEPVTTPEPASTAGVLLLLTFATGSLLKRKAIAKQD